MIISRIFLRPFLRMSRVISSGYATTGSNSRLSRPILRRISCHDRKSARGRRSPSVTEAVFSCTHCAVSVACVHAQTQDKRERGRRERSVYRLRSVTSRTHVEEIKAFYPVSLFVQIDRSKSSSSFSTWTSRKMRSSL